MIEQKFKSSPQRLEKTSHGHELWFKDDGWVSANLTKCYRKFWTENGKFLYHTKMDKTIFVISGRLLIHVIKNNILVANELQQHDSIYIPPRTNYRLTAVNCNVCEFILITTHSSEDDKQVIEIPEFKI